MNHRERLTSFRTGATIGVERVEATCQTIVAVSFDLFTESAAFGPLGSGGSATGDGGLDLRESSPRRSGVDVNGPVLVHEIVVLRLEVHCFDIYIRHSLCLSLSLSTGRVGVSALGGHPPFIWFALHGERGWIFFTDRFKLLTINLIQA